MAEERKDSFAETVDTAGLRSAHGQGRHQGRQGDFRCGQGRCCRRSLWGCGRGSLGRTQAYRQDHCRYCHFASVAGPVCFDAARLIFGGLINAFSPADTEQPVLNSETAIVENANDITFTINSILGEALDTLDRVLKRTLLLPALTRWRLKIPIPPALSTTPTLSSRSIALPVMKTLRAYHWMTWPLSCVRTKRICTPIPARGRVVRSHRRPGDRGGNHNHRDLDGLHHPLQRRVLPC